jgi:hypothetical protein
MLSIVTSETTCAQAETRQARWTAPINSDRFAFSELRQPNDENVQVSTGNTNRITQALEEVECIKQESYHSEQGQQITRASLFSPFLLPCTLASFCGGRVPFITSDLLASFCNHEPLLAEH